MPIPMRQRPQLLQALGHRRREPLLAADVRRDDEVLGRLHLVAAVRPPQLLDLQRTSADKGFINKRGARTQGSCDLSRRLKPAAVTSTCCV